MATRNAIFLAGPTAVGKSAVALALAQRLGGEIISVDSMQVYRGLDIGTAKPSPAERALVPHHLIDVVDLNETFDAALFVRLAGQAAGEIRNRSRVPIFCGGTGLYFKAFLEGMGHAPPSDPVLRSALESTPLSELLGELERTDPALLATIDRRNARRVVRAIEVIRLTGRPFSEQRARWSSVPEGGAAQAVRFFCLRRAPEDMRARIDARVDAMFVRGLMEETRELMARGLESNRTALQAIGYRQVVEHLRGERPLDETIELIKQRTRQFAKRQLTWFRHQFQPVWIDLNPDSKADDVACQIADGEARSSV